MGTSEGGRKAAAKNKANNPNFYSDIGRRGGSAKTDKPKGFAANPELARISGRKGGAISRKGKPLSSWQKMKLRLKHG